MRILIACHCKKPIYDEDEEFFFSPELQLLSNKNTINISDVEIYYVDKDDRCDASDDIPIQYKEWDSIPKNFFDYVWLEACPIWMPGAPHAKSILESAHEVLKPSGKVITALSTMYYTDEEDTEYISSVLREIPTKPYKLQVVQKDELPFSFFPKEPPEHPVILTDKYILLTKVVAGGRKRSTRRKKYKRTRKHTYSHKKSKRV